GARGDERRTRSVRALALVGQPAGTARSSPTPFPARWRNVHRDRRLPTRALWPARYRASRTRRAADPTASPPEQALPPRGAVLAAPGREIRRRRPPPGRPAVRAPRVVRLRVRGSGRAIPRRDPRARLAVPTTSGRMAPVRAAQPSIADAPAGSPRL